MALRAVDLVIVQVQAGQAGLGHGDALTRQHRLVDDGGARDEDRVTAHDAPVRRNNHHVSWYQVTVTDSLLVVVSSGPEDLDRARGAVAHHVVQGLGLGPGLVQGHAHRDQGDDDDAGRVVVVVVTHPQADARQLEDVEGVEHFINQQGEVGGDFDGDDIGTVKLLSNGNLTRRNSMTIILKQRRHQSIFLQPVKFLKHLFSVIPNISKEYKKNGNQFDSII